MYGVTAVMKKLEIIDYIFYNNKKIFFLFSF